MEHRQPDVIPRWSLDGRTYGCEAEYLAALAARAERRARIVARISVEEGQLLTMPGVPEEAVRRYYERLEPFWDGHGWHDVGDTCGPPIPGCCRLGRVLSRSCQVCR